MTMSMILAGFVPFWLSYSALFVNGNIVCCNVINRLGHRVLWLESVNDE